MLFLILSSIDIWLDKNKPLLKGINNDLLLCDDCSFWVCFLYFFHLFFSIEYTKWNKFLKKPWYQPFCRKSFLLLNFKLQLFSSSSSPPLYYCCIYMRRVWFHKLTNHDKELLPWHWKLTWTFFANFCWLFFWIIFNNFWAFVHTNLSLLCLEF